MLFASAVRGSLGVNVVHFNVDRGIKGQLGEPCHTLRYCSILVHVHVRMCIVMHSVLVQFSIATCFTVPHRVVELLLTVLADR